MFSKFKKKISRNALKLIKNKTCFKYKGLLSVILSTLKSVFLNRIGYLGTKDAIGIRMGEWG
jgi:hypothetical protein